MRSPHGDYRIGIVRGELGVAFWRPWYRGEGCPAVGTAVPGRKVGLSRQMATTVKE